MTSQIAYRPKAHEKLAPDMSLYTKITASHITYEQPLGLFIDNGFIKSVDGSTLETINPHNEQPICTVQAAGREDVDIAVKAARRALSGPWKTLPASDRGRLLLRLADLFEEHGDTIAAVESLDNGKSYQLAKADVGNAAGCLRYYGGWADKVHGQVIETNPQFLDYTRQEPIGVCGQIIPWNFPIMLWAWKVGPAIATGNTV
ncbi:aldehyde dehydrogenase (NAD(P)(+)) ald5, partial [Ascosphaera atra]